LNIECINKPNSKAEGSANDFYVGQCWGFLR
ncbi:hypothetical protein GWI33_012421, partial [Rhynchophorus ferrugineus]